MIALGPHRLALARSFFIYYGRPLRAARLARLYARLVPKGALAFDIGAHVGNRVRALRRAGAKVIALEPQPELARILRRLYGRDPEVRVIEAAVGERGGPGEMLVADRTPTVSTLSADWRRRMAQDPAFAGVRWNRTLGVDVTTLDALIAAFGEPAFVKLDVEGSELAALRGLTRPLAALSFEYLPAALDLPRACVERLESLARYEYNWSSGETHRLGHAQWLDVAAIKRWFESSLARRRPGDIYARRVGRQ
jgi:FkbM family methyltransferase